MNLEVKIQGKNKSYPIFINNNDLETLKNDILTQINNKNYIVVFSQKVYKLYGKLLNFDKNRVFVLKDGEDEKNIKNYNRILNFALSKKLTREDAIIAIGGGVVGDIAGFAASTYMRGINLIQVPTTLLADTDSSVGGKVAINTKFGKNLVGAFYQPKAVFINVNFLKTLDDRQFKSGLGEVIKYGFIENSCPVEGNANLISFLRDNYEKIMARDILTLRDLIKMCIELKISVVQADEKESGLRKILNFGHTYGHAVEKITNYKKFTHGECVVSGIRFAFDLAFNLNLIDKEYKFLSDDLLKLFNYKKVPAYDINKIIKIMETDKKATDEHIIFILPKKYGEVQEYNFTAEELKEIL